MTTASRIGDFKLLWGESLRWDERRTRLYFVDCAAQKLHWLDGAEPPLESMKMPGLPTGIELTDDGRLVVALDDGLHLVDPDEARTELLSPYPAGLRGRANDLVADHDGNLVTGTLNVLPGPGSHWWFSTSQGWRQLDDGTGNANGPVVIGSGQDHKLVFADTLADRIYLYDYDGSTGTVGPREILGETKELGGHPDGACADLSDGVWSCVLGAGKLARYTMAGLDQTLDTAGVELPSDVTFGGAELDRMFFVSIAVEIGDLRTKSPLAGALMVIDGTGHRGRVEPRLRL